MQNHVELCFSLLKPAWQSGKSCDEKKILGVLESFDNTDVCWVVTVFRV